MEIIINNEQYKYYFVGESFCRPSMDSFGITEADIISYNKYMEDYKKLESKREDVESGVSCFLGVIIYIGELLLLLFAPRPDSTILNGLLSFFVCIFLVFFPGFIFIQAHIFTFFLYER